MFLSQVANMQVTVTELQETVVSFKKLCVLLVTVMLVSQMALLYYMSAVNSSLSGAASSAEADDSWPPNLTAPDSSDHDDKHSEL